MAGGRDVIRQRHCRHIPNPLVNCYRAGDGNDESFTAPMIVSETDLAPGIPGEQNLWIKGVGCGPAVVHFSK